MVELEIQKVAVRVQVLRSFPAPDPWHGEMPVLWTLNLYRIVGAVRAGRGAPPRVAEIPAAERISGDPRKALLRGDEAIGIETGAWHRLLPRALNRLWARGEVEDPALPRLIKALEPYLRRRDFLRGLTGQGLWILGVMFGVPSLICFYLFLQQLSTKGSLTLFWFGTLLAMPGLACIVIEIATRRRDARLEAAFRATLAAAAKR